MPGEQDSSSVHPSFSLSEQTERTPLYLSLEHLLVNNTNIVTTDFIKNFTAIPNNPKPCRKPPYNDRSLLWLGPNGLPQNIVFPAVLHTEGKFSKCGPYFNIPNPEAVKHAGPGPLKKCRAQFELKPLKDDSDPDPLPQKAIDCSSRTLNLLLATCNDLEKKRNRGIDDAKRPLCNPFHRTYFKNDKYTFIMSSEPLFTNIVGEESAPVNSLSITDLLSNKSTQLPSPTKNVAGNCSRTSEPTLSTATSLQKMPDPDRVYSAMSHNSTSPIYIKDPIICASDGTIIPASDYGTILKQGMIFLVEGYLKMWAIPPNARKESSFQSRAGDENGNRTYQFIFTKMQLLPVNNAVVNATTRQDSTIASSTPKRKTVSTPQDNNESGPSKKKTTVTNKDKGKTIAMEL